MDKTRIFENGGKTMSEGKKEEDCDHEFEKKEIITHGDNSRIANICKHCGGEKEEMEG